jgi:hypothetical protein
MIEQQRQPSGVDRLTPGIEWRSYSCASPGGTSSADRFGCQT